MFKITDISNNIADVSSNNELYTIIGTSVGGSGNPSYTGNYVTTVNENDAGDVLGSPTQQQTDVSSYYRRRCTFENLIYSERFGASNFFSETNSNTNMFTTSVATLVANNSGGFSNLNSTNTTTQTTTGRCTTISSYRTFSFNIFQDYVVDFLVLYQSLGMTPFMTTQFGFMNNQLLATQNTSGIYFEYTLSGELRGVVQGNSVQGSETSNLTTLDCNLPFPDPNVVHKYTISIGQYDVEFWIDDVLSGTITHTTICSSSFLSSTSRLMFRQLPSYMTTTPVSLIVYSVSVYQSDNKINKPISHLMSSFGYGCWQRPANTNTVIANAVTTYNGQTSLYSNSMALVAGATATLTSCPLGLGLGGQFSWGTTTPFVSNSAIIMTYQNPIIATTLLGTYRNLYITGINYQSCVTVALGAVTIAYQTLLAYGASGTASVGIPATSAAACAVIDTNMIKTASTATTSPIQIVPLASEEYAASSAVGTVGRYYTQVFNPPLCISSGKYLNFCTKGGGVPGSGTITFLIGFDGYWM